MAYANSTFAACGATIFETMSQLAARHQSVNLGQGFPEGLEPPEMIEAVQRFCREGSHQYPSMLGTPTLRQRLAEHEGAFYQAPTGVDHCLVTSGATEALASCLFGLIEPGDEVIIFEPAYDSYRPIIQRAGGVVRAIRLEPPEWRLPREQLQAALTSKTRLVVLNNPNNPTGGVLGLDDALFLQDFIPAHNLMLLCDEVYEHLIYAGHQHHYLLGAPALRRHCVKVGSAGKIFSLTGWKVGWVIAEPEVLQPIIRAHQFLTFTTPPMLQEAVAWGLQALPDYYRALPQILAPRRDRLAECLRRAGFGLLPVQGGYFQLADIQPLKTGLTDREFCVWLTEQVGVTAIPVSAFYGADPPSHLVRFCFAKTDHTLDRAIQRLMDYFVSDKITA